MSLALGAIVWSVSLKVRCVHFFGRLLVLAGAEEAFLTQGLLQSVLKLWSPLGRAFRRGCHPLAGAWGSEAAFSTLLDIFTASLCWGVGSAVGLAEAGAGCAARLAPRHFLRKAGIL